MAQRYTTVGGVKIRQEPAWKTYIDNYQGPIVYSGQPFVYKGKTRIVPRGALYLPEYDDEPAVLVLARNGEAIDINSIPMANSDQTPNKAKKSLNSATQMLDRAQKPGYQEQNKSFEIKKGLGQAIGNEGLYGGVKRAAGGAYSGVKAVGAGLLGTLTTGSLLPLLAGGLYGAKKVIGGALGGLGIAAGGIMKGIGNVTGITPAVGKAWGGLKSMVGMGGPTKAERAGPLTNGQFIDFEAKLFGYIDKEIDRDKRRLERMKRQSEYDEEAADESRGGERPGTPVRDGGSEKKPMSGLMKGLMVLGGIVTLVAAITAIVAYKDELLKIWDEYGTALKVAAGIITGLGIADAGASLLDMLPGGGGGPGRNPPPPPPPPGAPVRRNFTVDKDGKFFDRNGNEMRKGAALDTAKATHAQDLAKIKGGTKFAKAGALVKKFLKPFDPIVKKLPFIGAVLETVMSAGTLYDAYEDYEEEIKQAGGDKNKEKAAEEKLGTLVFREVGMQVGTAGGAALGSLAVPILGSIAGAIIGADVGVEIGQAAAQSYFKGGDFLEILGGLLKEKYKANIADQEKMAADQEKKGTQIRTRSGSESIAAYKAYAAGGGKMSQNEFSQQFTKGKIDEKGAPVADSATVAAPPPGDSVAAPPPGDYAGDYVVDNSQQAQPNDIWNAQHRFVKMVGAAADKAIITLPAKVLEGPPMVMPSPETGQGSAPGEIQTRPNDRTLNSASSNLNASRQMTYR